MRGGKLLLFCTIVLSAFLIFCSSKADALTLYNAGYNMSSVQQAYYGLGMAETGGSNIIECDCAWWDIWCKLTCHDQYLTVNCFGDDKGDYLSSYAGASGVGYFNATCDTPDNFMSMGIYAHSAVSPYAQSMSSPSSRTTVFAQVKYRVNNWTGVNTSAGKYPILAMYDSNNLSQYYATANLTLVANTWEVATVWHTFNASSNFTTGILISEIDGMVKGWTIYIDYFRVGTVDMDRYVTSSPDTAADCAWSTGSAGCGWSGTLNGTYVYNDPNRTVAMSIVGHSLGEDSSVPCESFYTDWTDNPSIGSKYSVRMADEMPPWESPWDYGSGSWYDPNGWLGGANWNWCNIKMKDLLFHDDYYSRYTGFVGPAYTYSEQSIGMIDSVNSTYAKPSWFSAYANCVGLGCGGQTYGYCQGFMQFNDSGVIKSITECEVEGSSLGYFRYPINLSNHSITNPSAWSLSGFAVIGSYDGLSTGWIPMSYYDTMFNASCDEGWYCNGTEEYWLDSSCIKHFESNCSGICGCSGSRCFQTTGYWQCGSNMTSYHYNSTCNNDLQLLCDNYCDGGSGRCFNETNCLSDIDCSNFCDGEIRYYGGYCDIGTYTCGWHNSEACGYGCSPLGCSGAPPSPPLFGNGTDITTLRPADIIGSIYYGVLGFVNAMGGSFFFFIFLIIAIIIIVLFVTIVPHIVKEAFD